MKNHRLMRLISLMLCMCLVFGLFSAIAPVDAAAVDSSCNSESATISKLSDNEKNVTINMFDSYGDGWGNNAINVFENGVLIGTATIMQGKEDTWSYTMDPDKEYQFVWVKGAWSSECYFDIIIGGEKVHSATVSDCNLYANGAVIYPLCQHINYDSVVTLPTCTKDGYTTYSCTKCGESYTGDETPATGHYFGEDDFCDVCGFDINSIHAVISMNDSFGDGWNGNSILVYENGVLIDTLTLETGMRNGTWIYDMDRNKEYDFFWRLGNFPNECSFTISYDDETVFTATQSVCSGFKNNQLIYPPCLHVSCDAVVTPETCTTVGYTTYTCNKCGEVFTGDIVPATGHQYGDDSICDNCGFDKDGIIIYMNDSYGDGWNGNAIEIYEDGVLIDTATLTSGANGIFVISVDEGKEYIFNWVKGSSSYECSFDIMLDGEIQYAASGGDCDRFVTGQQVYPYFEYSGWTILGNKVFYFDPVTHRPVTNANRLPYPTEPLNGITYAPNPEDVAHAESLGQTFIDKDEAWFVFDGFSGELMQDVTAIRSVGVEGTYTYRYVVQGMLAWHVGLVEELGEYWYFAGDPVHGGNIVSYGDVLVTRNNTDFDMFVGGVYTFDLYGHMCKYDGITKVDGVLRYYQNYRLMQDNGLTKVGDNFIYVLSNGELVVDAEYDVAENALGIAAGTYTFDQNGFLLDPIPAEKNGVYLENGAWYYYENGKLSRGKGLINVATYWHYPDGSVEGLRAFIYVRSNGQLATGDYYITNVENDASGLFCSGQKVSFSEDGMAYAPNHGIVDVNGTLYFYQHGVIQYSAGLIEVNGGWIYVRSNGKLATGKYWITNTNGAMESGYYEFDENGFMVVSDVEDGIVVEGESLCYYQDGMKQFGLGLVKLEDGSYIYVRTNGELAVGSYWITNHNDLLDEGMYEFDQDGILITN